MRTVISLISLFFTVQLNAQLLEFGRAIVTNEGTGPADYVLRILETRDPQFAPLGYDWPSRKITHADWIKGSNTSVSGCQNCTGMGNIFGIAYSTASPADIFVTSTNIYQSTCYGKGGAGAVYKIDRTDGHVITFCGTSQTFINHNTDSTNQIWNTGPGLGNVCYAAELKAMYVTNFEDGKIYKITPFGIIQATYDPFGDDNKTAGYCPLGERIWGIGYYNNRLYFSRWSEDATRTTNGLKNGIYSIELGLAGSFPGTLNSDGSYHDATETPEIICGGSLIPNFPYNLSSYSGTTANYPNLNNITAPISDIEFSSDGKMLVAERSMPGNKVSSNFDFNAAHFSRVFEFEKSNNQWQNTTDFFVGNIYSSTNCAGGIDYGYGQPGCDSATKNIFADGSYSNYLTNNLNNVSNCEKLVWSTGDGLRYPQYNPSGNNSNYDNTIYGIAAIPISGNSNNPNTANWVKTTSIYVDLDSVWNVPKTSMGDVDIYRMPCRENTCSTVGMQNAKAEYKHLILAPNPASTYTVLNSTDFTLKGQTVYLTNLMGQIIKTYTFELNNGQINLDGISSGDYIVVVPGYKNIRLTVAK